MAIRIAPSAPRLAPLLVTLALVAGCGGGGSPPVGQPTPQPPQNPDRPPLPAPICEPTAIAVRGRTLAIATRTGVAEVDLPAF